MTCFRTLGTGAWAARERAALALLAFGAFGAVSACGGLFGVDFDDAHPQSDGGSANPRDGGSQPGQDGSSAADSSGLADGGATSDACAAVCPGPIATQQVYPKALAIDDVNVYWANQGSGSGGSIATVAKTGGTPIVLATGLATPTDLAVHGGYVYWTDQDDGTVMRARTTMANSGEQIAFGQSHPTGIRVDDSYVYWTNNGISDDGTLQRAPIAGGAASPIASMLFGPGYLAIDAVNAYLALDTGGVAYTALAGGDTLHYVGVDGTSTMVGTPAQVVLSGGTLYWTDLSTNTVYRGDIDGGGAQGLAGGSEPEGIATDGVNVYWSDRAGGSVNRVPVHGGTTTPIATGLAYPWGVAVDEAYVYWTDGTAGTVNRAPK